MDDISATVAAISRVVNRLDEICHFSDGAKDAIRAGVPGKKFLG